MAQNSAYHYDDFRESAHKQWTGIGPVLSEQSISNACGPQLWSPDHERHIYIRWVYIGVTWITIAVYSYNISIAILAQASASAKAWWWFFESYPQQAAMMSRLWYPPGQRSTLKKLESLILLFPLYKNIIFHSMFSGQNTLLEQQKKTNENLK